MSKIIVIVDTDHTDDDEAIKSVSNGLKRAGYVYKDYQIGRTSVGMNPPDNAAGYFITSKGDGLLQFEEPEVSGA